MTLCTEMTAAYFGLLFACSIASTFLGGSTVQWTLNKGLMEKKALAKSNQYNVLVAIAGSSSMIHTLLCFFNNLTAPNNPFGIGIAIVVNWIVMTNSSIMLVSQRLSLTFQQPTLAWNRLLWINYIAVPCCCVIGVSWAVSHNAEEGEMEGLKQFVKIIEPIQIAVFGVIEFVLSGAFIVQMWKYRWTDVERHSMFMLILVGLCDLLSVFLNLFMGDLESTCVKGLVYSLRIRLEVNVLCCMVDYIKNRRGMVTYGSSGTGTQKRRSASGYFGVNKSGTTKSQKSSARSRSQSKKLTRFDSEINRLRDEMDSSHTNGRGEPSAPFNSNGKIPTRISPDSTQFVSQLRSSIDSRPPSEESIGEEDLIEDGEYFSNDYIRNHVLASRREERKQQQSVKEEEEAKEQRPAELTVVQLANDTISTVPAEQSASSHTFHNDIDGDISIIMENENSDPNPPPFDGSNHSGAKARAESSSRQSGTYLLNNSTGSALDAYHDINTTAAPPPEVFQQEHSLNDSHASALTMLQDQEQQSQPDIEAPAVKVPIPVNPFKKSYKEYLMQSYTQPQQAAQAQQQQQQVQQQQQQAQVQAEARAQQPHQQAQQRPSTRQPRASLQNISASMLPTSSLHSQHDLQASSHHTQQDFNGSAHSQDYHDVQHHNMSGRLAVPSNLQNVQEDENEFHDCDTFYSPYNSMAQLPPPYFQ